MNYSALFLGVASTVLIGAGTSSIGFGQFFKVVWFGSLGTGAGLTGTLQALMPLVGAGLAVLLPFCLGLWNVGVPGQILMGAWGAAAIAFAPGLGPAGVRIPLMIIAAAASGGAMALLPAIGRVRFGVSEILATLLLNYVAGFWMSYWIENRWLNPDVIGGQSSKPIPSNTWIGNLNIKTTAIPVGLLLLVLLAVGLGWVLKRTWYGYEFDVLSASPRTGAYAGIPGPRRMIEAMVGGGAIAGVTGAMVMMGSVHDFGIQVTDVTSLSSSGYIGIIIALLAARSAIRSVGLAVIFAVLSTAGTAVAATGSSADLVAVTLGITVALLALADGISHVRITRVGTEPVPGGEAAFDSARGSVADPAPPVDLGAP
jgi:simple sugar transport system permease protein